MRKFLISIILIIPFVFTSCSDDKENGDSPSPAEKEILQVLNGKFIGSLYSFTTNTTETEEITFTP